MATLVERGEEAPDLCIGVGEEAGEHLLLAGHHPPFVVGQRTHALTHCGRSLSVVPGGTTPDSSWRRSSVLASIPAIVERSSVGCHPLGGDVVGACIARARSTRRTACPGRVVMVLHIADGDIGEVLGEVVAIFGSPRGPHSGCRRQGWATVVGVACKKP